ncbi:MAG: helix-turn-helix transcriptional regulator [Actinobacteria bacterium]|nr:helix-turn-helix transcriptional regulator [Actinomycetota bacterium]
MAADLLRGQLDLLLLSVLADEPMHGYAAIEELRRRGGFELPEGTVYPALHRLEAAGLLDSRWSTVSGRRRRVYALTRSGRRELARRRVEWRAFARAVEAVVT